MYPTEAKELNLAFEALGHPKRRGMLQTLSFRPATISQLAEEYDLSLPAMHKHVKVLEAARLVHRRKAGRTNFLALNKKSLRAVQDWIMQYHTAWGNDQETLDNYIASFKE